MLVIRRAPAEESARQAITTDQSIQAPSAATRAFSRGFVENNHWLTAGKGDGGIGATGDEAFKKGAEPPKSPPDWEPWLKKNPVCWKAWKNVAGRSPEQMRRPKHMILPISSAAKEGIKSVPDIIKAAATTPVGIFGLMIICLGVLGFAFFNKANEYIRLVIFMLLSGGVLAFGLSITNEANRHKTSASGAAPPSATVLPARRATITYTTTAPRWEPANWITQQVTTDNRDGMGAEGRSPTSPDGKWWASEKTATLQVGATGTKQRLTNASFVFIAGAGASTEARGPFYNQDSTTITATVKGWSGPATYELKAQIEEQKDLPKENTTSLVINENPFVIAVPQTTSNARLTIADDSQLLSVKMGETKEPLIFVKREANGSLTEYTYRIKD